MSGSAEDPIQPLAKECTNDTAVALKKRKSHRNSRETVTIAPHPDDGNGRITDQLETEICLAPRALSLGAPRALLGHSGIQRFY